jgi:nitrite reductase/ring-hydroxylating ferredoxin subunit
MTNDERNAPQRDVLETERAERVSRRGFNKFLTLGSLAAAAGAAGVLTAGCSKTYPTIVVAHAGDISVGESKIFSYPSDVNPCLLLRPAENTYLAYSRICTHTSCPVFYRPEENRIICPCHGGVYSVADGSVLAGPPPRPLPKIELERRGDDLVAVGVIKG